MFYYDCLSLNFFMTHEDFYVILSALVSYTETFTRGLQSTSP